VSKEHAYVKAMRHDMAISPLLQSHILEFSNALPFNRAMKLLRTAIPSAQVNASQAQRLVQHFGKLEEMEQLLRTPGFGIAADAVDSEPAVFYAQVDGGHLLTDEGFRETKVGRLFAGHHIKQISSGDEEVNLRNSLEKSDYLAHMGYYEDFINRFNPLIDNHLKAHPEAKMVIVSDGADWIARWAARDYPDAMVILDFYHAAEKLCEFAKMVFNSEEKRHRWIENRKEELLDGQIEKVVLAIRTKALGRRATIMDKASDIIQYYNKNSYRMHYDEYLEAGYCIGSGAIESAISTVAQQRCKLVGQRWTQRVAAVLNLRAAFKSDKHKGIRQLINYQMGHQWTA